MDKPRENQLLQIRSRVSALILTATKRSAADRSATRLPGSLNLLTTWQQRIFRIKTNIAWSYQSPTIKCHSIGVHRTEAGHNEAFRIITSTPSSLSSIEFTCETLHYKLEPMENLSWDFCIQITPYLCEDHQSADTLFLHLQGVQLFEEGFCKLPPAMSWSFVLRS